MGILLKDLQEQPTYSKVLVKAKVMNVEAVTKLAGGLRKQEVTIADSTAPARLTLWEDNIDTLNEFDCYHFQPLTVRAFKSQIYILQLKRKDVKLKKYKICKMLLNKNWLVIL